MRGRRREIPCTSVCGTRVERRGESERLGAKSGMLRGRGGRRPCCRLPREERTIREAASFVACSGATETFGGLNFTPVDPFLRYKVHVLKRVQHFFNQRVKLEDPVK